MNEKQISCCFSGHRPDKLPWGFDESHPDCIRLKELLLKEILSKYRSGITRFYTGMAAGVDMWCAELVLHIVKNYPETGLELIGAIPHIGQERSWTPDLRERYYNILESCSEKVVLCDRYAPGCMHNRNRYLVDNSSHLIAVISETRGGTKFTINYARKQNLNIRLINPKALDLGFVDFG